jgi:hypothetical protein
MTTQPTDAQIRAIRLAADLIVEAAQEAGPLGAPSGVIYAALMGAGMTLDTYNAILGALQQAGRVRVENHCVHVC